MFSMIKWLAKYPSLRNYIINNSVNYAVIKGKAIIINQVDGQIKNVNNILDKSLLQYCGEIGLKYKSTICGVLLVVGLAITGAVCLSAALVFDFGRKLLISLISPVIVSSLTFAIVGGLILAVGDTGLAISATIENYLNDNVKEPHYADVLISGLNNISKKKEIGEICNKFTEQYQVVDLMFKNSL
jgi:hypothetical protein